MINKDEVFERLTELAKAEEEIALNRLEGTLRNNECTIGPAKYAIGHTDGGRYMLAQINNMLVELWEAE